MLILGEYTNNDGPFLDDYFLVFVTRAGQSYRASFYCEGRDEFVEAFGTNFGASIVFALVGSTDFASSVLWPSELAGKPLYEFADVPPQGKVGKALHWLRFGSKSVTYSEVVSAALRKREIESGALQK